METLSNGCYVDEKTISITWQDIALVKRLKDHAENELHPINLLEKDNILKQIFKYHCT